MKMINKKLIVVLAFSGFFAGNSFAKNADQLRALYAELRRLQSYAPEGEEAKKESARAGSHVGVATWQKLFDNAAQGEGLNKMYTNIMFPPTRVIANAYQHQSDIFQMPGNLQWTAYLQNKHGREGVLTYDEREAGTEDYNNPVMGIYMNQYMKKITITRYGFLEGLFQAIDNATEEMIKKIPSRMRGLEFSLKVAIEAAKKQGSKLMYRMLQ